MLIDEIASYSQVATAALAAVAGTWSVVRRRRRQEGPPRPAGVVWLPVAADPGDRSRAVLVVLDHDGGADARALLDLIRSARRSDERCP